MFIRFCKPRKKLSSWFYWTDVAEFKNKKFVHRQNKKWILFPELKVKCQRLFQHIHLVLTLYDDEIRKFMIKSGLWSLSKRKWFAFFFQGFSLVMNYVGPTTIWISDSSLHK